ncbi:MAG: hypothetical protein B6I34_07220 [Anaerolineaceae bacterium 4572_32.1]|nr:MAG: hypothetical protein B6I34_07220 [Anaerolineaceae bacterium 4572_32.1]
MFGRSKNKGQKKAPPLEQIETVIGPTADFKGTLQTDGSVRIDGLYDGSIKTMGNLIIGEQAQITADIKAHNVSVSGVVKGDINANRVEVLETGQIWGDLTVNSFTLDDGGFVSGQVNMQTDSPLSVPEAPKKQETQEPAPPESDKDESTDEQE